MLVFPGNVLQPDLQLSSQPSSRKLLPISCPQGEVTWGFQPCIHGVRSRNRDPGPWGVLQFQGAYLIADVQCKDDGEDAGGGVPSVALKPAVKDILDEGWVVD